VTRLIYDGLRAGDGTRIAHPQACPRIVAWEATALPLDKSPHLRLLILASPDIDIKHEDICEKITRD